MPTPAIRKLLPTQVRNFGQILNEFELPDLTSIQPTRLLASCNTVSTHHDRKDQGIEEILREIFPIESYDKQFELQDLMPLRTR